MLKKMICFMVGMLIIQTGASLFILTEIGSDPFTVFIQAISYKLHSTPGVSNMMVTLLILVAIFFIDKSYIKIGTVLGMLTAGPCLDMMIHFLGDIPFAQFSYPIRILCVILGCIIVALGFSILVSSTLGACPNDLIPFMLNDKWLTSVQYRSIKIILDLTFVTIGFFLGGVVGIGTLIGAFMTGPFVQLFLKRIQKSPYLKFNNQAEISELDVEML